MPWLNSESQEKQESLWALEEGMATQEEYKHKEKSRRTKAQLELNLAKSVRDKKCFCKYINNKMRAQENLHSSLVTRGTIVAKDEDKAEDLNAFFAPVFNVKVSCSMDALCQEMELRSRKKLPKRRQ